MLFNSWPYVLFLILALALYWRIHRQVLREYLLLVAGYVFYMAWFPPYAILLAALTVFGYGVGAAMGRYQQYRRPLLVTGIAVPLLVLVHYKYWGLILQSLTGVAAWSGLSVSFAAERIILPLGISFFTFELICYVVDLYRGTYAPVREFHRFALFMAFFPKLIAGPITRPHEFFPQLGTCRVFDRALFLQGLHLFITGLFLKVGVADVVSPYVDQTFGHPGGVGFADAWVATYAFAIQIFCDFAGYTAMARGSALLFGIHLPDNFDAPYFASNLSEFWRRWHMSLTRWLRDYLYIPLGGSRGTILRTCANLFVTMMLAGLWHGAQWTFVAWGMFLGLCLVLHKLWQRLDPFPVPAPIGALLTFHVVCLGWVFFRAASLADAVALLTSMINPSAGGASLTLDGRHVLVLTVLFLAGHLLIRQAKRIAWPPSAVLWGRSAFNALVLVILCSASASSQKFIYFQF